MALTGAPLPCHSHVLWQREPASVDQSPPAQAHHPHVREGRGRGLPMPRAHDPLVVGVLDPVEYARPQYVIQVGEPGAGARQREYPCRRPVSAARRRCLDFRRDGIQAAVRGKNESPWRLVSVARRRCLEIRRNGIQAAVRGKNESPWRLVSVARRRCLEILHHGCRLHHCDCCCCCL